MKQKITFYYTRLLLWLLLLGPLLSWARSVHRTQDLIIPEIQVRYTNDATSYSLKSSHLELYPFFQLFDKQFFDTHLLPTAEAIPYRYNPEQSVQGQTLSSLIEELLVEIKQKRKQYTHFIVLQRKNFNRKKACGLMVLKFKNYPFIIKLAIETPKTFTNPYCKGIDNIWFLPLGGGINRHIAGLTRVKNLETIKNRIAQDLHWASIIDTPRKWYWLPKDHPWLSITGFNIGGHTEISSEMPSIYCIVADAIESDRKLTLFDKHYTKITMKLCNYLEHWIDPHIDNFMVEKNSNKIVIIDTEHFPSVVGIKEKVSFKNYGSWLMYLASKCARDWFFRTKKERLIAQQRNLYPSQNIRTTFF